MRASAGVNVGLAFLAGAIGFDVAARPELPAALASRVVLFDAFASNVDRTARNPNVLWWNGALWLIDHGAAFYWHYGWDGSTTGSDRPFVQVREHVLLPWASAAELAAVGESLTAALTDEVIAAAVAAVPDEWLPPRPGLETPAATRDRYAAFLRARRDALPRYQEEAVRSVAPRV